MKKTISGRLLVALIVMIYGWKMAEAAGPACSEQIAAGAHGAGQSMTFHDLFDHLIEISAGATSEDELREVLENDHLVKASGLVMGSDITVGSVKAGDCYVSPLLCLLKWYTPDLRCVYDCIGLRGTGEITSRNPEECDVLAGCILFENCLALCISIIPYDLRPVIWW